MSLNIFSVLTFLIFTATLNSVAFSGLIEKSPSEYVIGNVSASACETQKYEWTCFANYTIEDVGISVCFSLKYLVKEYGGEMKLTINGFPIIDEKLSLVNPPPICADVPYLEKIAKLCIDIHDISFDENHVSGCVKIQGVLKYLKSFDIEIGCFNIPLKEQLEEIKVILLE